TIYWPAFAACMPATHACRRCSLRPPYKEGANSPPNAGRALRPHWLQCGMHEERFDRGDALSLFFRSWRPATTPRGAVVIVHGFNSHSGYYTWVAEQLVIAGLAVYALDLRGRGQSDGERFYVDAFADYVADVSRFVALVKGREPDLPVFLLGHSAGGVIACLYSLDHQRELAGLICESFAFQVPAPDFALAVLKGLSLVAPHAHVLH